MQGRELELEAVRGCFQQADLDKFLSTEGLEKKFTKPQVEACIKRVNNVNPQSRQNTSNLKKGVLPANFIARVNKAKADADLHRNTVQEARKGWRTMFRP